MKRFWAMALTVTMMGAVMAGCGDQANEAVSDTKSTSSESTAAEDTDTGSDTSDIKLGYVCMNLANPWFVEVVDGIKAACDELGIEEPMIVDSQYDVDKQVSDCESLVNDGYDGIIVSPIDQNALNDVIEQAKSAGIITTCIAQSQDNVDFRYIADEYTYGAAIGENAANWINENLKDQKVVKVAIISQDNVEDVIARGDGVQETLEKMCPNVDVVARSAGDTAEGGLQIIEGVLASDSDLQVVVATNDSGGIGGYQAMMNAGFTGDDPVAVFSGDATDEALNAMKEENTIYRGTVDLQPYQSGYDTVMKIYDYITEGKPDEQETAYYEPLIVPLADLLDGTYSKK